uniref:Uncharacterized protein n=1 Tax=viral metagenome TaxID=1070528 RepID=A0A6C0JGU0_9ZZZZ
MALQEINGSMLVKLKVLKVIKVLRVQQDQLVLQDQPVTRVQLVILVKGLITRVCLTEVVVITLMM